MQNFSQSTLLSAIVGIISVFGTVVTFDAERMIGAVDDLKAVSASDHQILIDHTQQLGNIVDAQKILFQRTNDHEVRLAKLEVPDAPPLPDQPPMPSHRTPSDMLNSQELKRHRGH